MFDFVEDNTFKQILERDYQEVEKCLEVKASKSVVVMTGSIIEALLMEYFIHNPPNGKTELQILRLSLFELIEEAHNENLISKRIKDLSTVVRDYRNYIHPGKEVRAKEFISEEAAQISFNLLKMIVEEVKNKYSKLYGYKADEIFNKLISDVIPFSVFEYVLDKLSYTETEKLLIKLTNFYLTYEEADWVRGVISQIKSRTKDKTFLVFLNQMKDEATVGNSEIALMLFKIYGEKLRLLKKKDANVVLDCIYDLIHDEGLNKDDDSLLNYEHQNIYQKLNSYKDWETDNWRLYSVLHTLIRNFEKKSDRNKQRYISIYKIFSSGIAESEIYKNLKDVISKEKHDWFKKQLNICFYDELLF